jgi:heme uptake protein IsdC
LFWHKNEVKGGEKRMKKLLFLALCISSLFLVSQAAAAPQLADGTYTIDYVIKQADNDNVSIANDYFEKPAKAQVKNGQANVEIQMNHSAWITEFKVPKNGNYVDAQVVNRNEAADTRVVRFSVPDLSEPLAVKIHVTVPDIDYDHDYTIRFVFDTNSLQQVQEVSAGNSGKEGAADPAPAAAGSAQGGSQSAVPAKQASVGKSASSTDKAGGAAAGAISGTPEAISDTPIAQETSEAAADKRVIQTATGAASAAQEPERSGPSAARNSAATGSEAGGQAAGESEANVNSGIGASALQSVSNEYGSEGSQSGAIEQGENIGDPSNESASLGETSAAEPGTAPAEQATGELASESALAEEEKSSGHIYIWIGLAMFVIIVAAVLFLQQRKKIARERPENM